MRVGSLLSSVHSVLSGTPQGSVLGPLLFIAYFNSVSSLPVSKSAKLIGFADDLAYVCPLRNMNTC